MPIAHTYSSSKPYAMLMKGRAEDGASHQSLAVYSKQEYQEYRAKGWRPAREFHEMIDRARRKDA